MELRIRNREPALPQGIGKFFRANDHEPVKDD
jgi:hypothetical protein